MNQETKTLGIINDQKITIIENGNRMVPIKPICQALGVDFAGQKEKIENDAFLKSTVGLSPMVAGDNKEREMFCIPFKYVFGWLFTINPKNVKEEARESVMNYRIQCYDILYDHFTSYSDFIKVRSELVETKVEKLENYRTVFSQAKKDVEGAKKELAESRAFTYEEWLGNRRQLPLWTTEEETNEN